MKRDTTYEKYTAGSDELVGRLVEEHAGWATAIAKSVARAWNLDWQLDGLDGGAFEGLLFCAQRYDPAMGVPFKAYARRRIHEASTEEARKSKSWQRGVGSDSPAEQEAREISATMFELFPEMREGLLPVALDDDEEGLRMCVRQMITGAALVAAFKDSAIHNPEKVVEYRRLLEVVAALEPIHQEIMWAIYWKGQSMRNLATEWGIDELSIIREHKEIVDYLSNELADDAVPGKKKIPKIRRGLKPLAIQLKHNKEAPPFARFASAASWLVIAFFGNESAEYLYKSLLRYL